MPEQLEKTAIPETLRLGVLEIIVDARKSMHPSYLKGVIEENIGETVFIRDPALSNSSYVPGKIKTPVDERGKYEFEELREKQTYVLDFYNLIGLLKARDF